jgi:hypothetical protein
MNKTLYDEAVADAHKLRELAEETAKNRIVEAVMPEIRNLVNRRILGEDLEDMESEEDDYMSDEDLGVDLMDLSGQGPSQSDETHVDLSTSGNSPNVGIEVTGDVNINLEVETEEDSDELVLSDQMAEALTRLIKGEEISKNETLDERVEALYSRVNKLSEVTRIVEESQLNDSQNRRIELSLWHCVREAIKLRAEVIITECKTQERLERRLTETIKEIIEMSKSNRRNIFDFLFEEQYKESKTELEEAELSLGLSDEEHTELADAEDADAVEGALEDILGNLELSLAPEAEEGDGADEELDAEPSEEPAEEEDDEESLDLGEADMEEMYEIDESMLRRELRRMTRLHEEAADEADAFGGGEVQGDVILDIDEEDLINALEDELGSQDIVSNKPMVAVESRRRSSTRRSSRRPDRRLSEARRENVKYKRAVSGLKKQLVEMNLFNAKLLYANKLMQNTNLSMKQQKAIVEALDNAKTLREAKLLFKSLSESLSRRSRGKKLSEGSLRTLGSSSKSTRSAQPKPSGVEVDRWGVLAGLYGKD